jgi:branched-chain amino acid transport system substrate-binding protein
VVNPSESSNTVQYTYDVFVSYSTRDEAWVRGDLLQRLEHHGLRVCIDYRDFRPGFSNIDEIKRAIRESRRILLVLTPDYISSRWGVFERQIVQNREPLSNGRLIPLLREPCELPDEINHIIYVNLTQPDSALAWERLLGALAPSDSQPSNLTPQRRRPGATIAPSYKASSSEASSCESTLRPSASSPRPPARQNLRASFRLITVGSGIALVLLIGILGYFFRRPDLCPDGKPKVGGNCTASREIMNLASNPNLSESISSGERLLLNNSQRNDSLGQAVRYFRQRNYRDAATEFQKAPKNPEAVIYANNALARQQGNPYVLAVVIPANSEKQDIAQEILRGAADAQTRFNQTNSDGRRLVELVIANDSDNPKIAQEIAQVLVNPKFSILGIIGHYSSQASEAALKIYEPKSIAMVSPTSTSTTLSLSSSKVFFRTVPSNLAYAQKLAEFILTTNTDIQRIAVFYHKGNTYSETFKNDFNGLVQNSGITLELIDIADPSFDSQMQINNLHQKEVGVALLVPSSEMTRKVLGIAQANNKQATNQKLKLFGGDILYSPDTLIQSGIQSGLEFFDMVLVVPWFAKGVYAKDAENRWGGQISYRTAGSFDAAQALISTLHTEPTRLDILERLRKVNMQPIDSSGKATTSGAELKFQDNGDRAIEPALVRVAPRGEGVAAPEFAEYGFREIR